MIAKPILSLKKPATGSATTVSHVDPADHAAPAVQRVSEDKHGREIELVRVDPYGHWTLRGVGFTLPEDYRGCYTRHSLALAAVQDFKLRQATE
jgi:hypothetical protein